MDDPPPSDLGISTDRQDFLRIAGLFDAPAYIRRARAVDEAFAHLVARCRRQRDEWLPMPRLRLATLLALAGTWQALSPVVEKQDIDALARLHAELAPSLQAPPPVTASVRRLTRALQELMASNERFNARWLAYLPKVDLTAVNELRDGYNRYYVLEKACALRSDLLARHGFEPRPMLTVEELFALMPLLPVPRQG